MPLERSHFSLFMQVDSLLGEAGGRFPKVSSMPFARMNGCQKHLIKPFAASILVAASGIQGSKTAARASVSDTVQWRRNPQNPYGIKRKYAHYQTEQYVVYERSIAS
jgi:hypothetical protein